MQELIIVTIRAGLLVPMLLRQAQDRFAWECSRTIRVLSAQGMLKCMSNDLPPFLKGGRGGFLTMKSEK